MCIVPSCAPAARISGELVRSQNHTNSLLTPDSSYFLYFGPIPRRAQFTGFNCRVGASNEESRVVHIPGISASIMNSVIEYAYLRRTNVNDDNVHELLICADYVGMVGLVKQCKDYLSLTLSPENCVSIMGFAR